MMSAAMELSDKIYLGFDMGIRNLAYCLIKHTAEGAKILKWDNIDLLEGGKSSQDSNKCTGCISPASWISYVDSTKWCKSCATQTRVKKKVIIKPSLPAIPCTLTIKALKTLALESESLDKPLPSAKKDEYIKWAYAHYLIPWKPVKATSVSLNLIRSAFDKWLDGEIIYSFSKTSLIRLENQPVMKGPTMKSVQIILFTLLAHRLEYEFGWHGDIEFVHAGTKTKNITEIATAAAETESDAYKSRKLAAETETVEILKTMNDDANIWLDFFKSRKKKSDLADAFLMAYRL